MNITIIGVGLIGGSLALGLRGFQTSIIGVETNHEHAQQALELKLVDDILPLERAVKLADLVILAIPVNVAHEVLPQVLHLIKEETVVVDMGSTKQGICSRVNQHPKRANFVATHPIAGTENSGPKAAFKTLFNNKTTIICEKERSADFALDVTETMYKLLNMKIIYMEPQHHDRHIAYVSHLSHISSFTLGLTVLDIEKNEKTIFDMAGSGFASTVRLAKSSPGMWNPIFQQNKKHITKALDAYIQCLSEFNNHIKNDNFEALDKLMHQANDIRRILDEKNI